MLAIVRKEKSLAENLKNWVEIFLEGSELSIGVNSIAGLQDEQTEVLNLL